MVKPYLSEWLRGRLEDVLHLGLGEEGLALVQEKVTKLVVAEAVSVVPNLASCSPD